MKRLVLFTAILFFTITLPSCSPQPKIPTLTEAHKKFIELCKEEYHLDVVVKQTGNTLWIYVPLQTAFFDYKAVPKKDENTIKEQMAYDIRLLEAEFTNDILMVQYNIVKEKRLPQDLGYDSFTPEEYNEAYRGILHGLYRIYFNIDDVPGDAELSDPKKQRAHKELVESYVRTDAPPEFFHIVFADIKRGIRGDYIGTLEDYKKYSVQSVVHDDYVQRLVVMTSGDLNLIDNTTAETLSFEAVTWNEFFRLQLVHRIRFQFTQSAHPPQGPVSEAIENIIQEIDAAYPEHKFPAYQLIEKN
ncbi:MAG: hypothetical protein KC618_03765 [Candidatus Omnitrophica bacterium]|nr:hypothetical protein [Candidatus Omnitrophota bacterium]